MSSSRMPTMGHGPSRDEESRETYSQFTGKVFISTREDTGPAYTNFTLQNGLSGREHPVRWERLTSLATIE